MMRRIALVLCLVGLLACGRQKEKSSDSFSERAHIPPKPPEHLNPVPEALDRKARSEKRLKLEGVKIDPTLPVIDSEAEAKVRGQDAVVDRAVALMIVAVKGEGLEQPSVLKVRDLFGATPFFTPKEKAFLLAEHPSERAKTQFAWRYEGLVVLRWALGFAPSLARPDKVVDAGELVGFMKDKGPKKFRDEARLRSPKELLDEADLIYRYDWACVDARETGKPAAPGRELRDCCGAAPRAELADRLSEPRVGRRQHGHVRSR